MGKKIEGGRQFDKPIVPIRSSPTRQVNWVNPKPHIAPPGQIR
jgi:hypothetical protein